MLVLSWMDPYDATNCTPYSMASMSKLAFLIFQCLITNIPMGIEQIHIMSELEGTLGIGLSPLYRFGNQGPRKE